MQCSQIIKNINNTINDVNNVKFSLIQKIDALNDSFRNLLKLNGFILKSDDDNFGYEWNDYGGYPEGHDLVS